jgi:hypothetical protein
MTWEWQKRSEINGLNGESKDETRGARKTCPFHHTITILALYPEDLAASLLLPRFLQPNRVADPEPHVA